MPGNELVQLLHRHASSNTACLALPGLGRAGVVAVSVALAGPQRHRARAFGAEADAGQQGRPADDASRRDLRIARSQMRLHRIERDLIDQGWNLDGDYLVDRLQLLALAALVEFVAADIGRPGQDPVNLS
jgi:hypothetical protein